MAMTLRLSPDESEALRRRASAEGTSMQDVARRALGEYIRAREPELPIGLIIDQELGRFAGTVEMLGAWRD
jgi:predicted transcriptional regulator